MTDMIDRLRAGLEGQYEIREKVGEGGMSDVYLATDVKHDRQVALKVLKPDIASALGNERFLAEINIAAGLTHPHVLTVHDSGQVGGSLYYVMPYIEGESLKERLARAGPLPIDEILGITKGVAAALVHAHERGIVHRDIKPGNILLADGVPLVTDFGVALAVSEVEEERLTRTGMAIGTPAYMSPEQASGERNLDGRSDLYSLACVVYEMLTGEPPLNGPTNLVILARRIVETPLPIRTVRDTVPVDLERSVLKALATAPADRHRSVEQFRQELEDGSLEVRRRSISRRLSGGVGPRSRRRLAWGAAAAVALGLTWVGVQSMSGAGEVSENLLAVFPFQVSGGEEHQFLSEAVASLLSAALNGAGDLVAVDPRSVLIRAEIEGLRGPDAAAEASIAGSFQAGRHLVGRVVASGTIIGIEAVVRQNGQPDSVTAEIQGEVSNLMALVEGLALQLLSQGELTVGQSASAVRARLLGEDGTGASAVLLTDSLEALKAFLRGERDFREGRGNDALVSFQTAVDIDSEFALAFHRLSWSAWHAQRFDLVEPAADQALALLDRLSDQDSTLVLAFAAYRRGEADAARQGYGSVVEAYPNNVEGLLMLAETDYHFGPLAGQPSTMTRLAYERLLDLDPNQRTALGHLAGVAAAEGNRNEVDSLVGKYLRLYPEADLVVWMHVLRAVALDDDASRTVVEEAFASGEATPLDLMFGAAFYGDFEWADEWSDAASDTTRPIQERLGGLGLGPFIKVATGRIDSALAQLGTIESLVPGLALPRLFEANLALAPLAERPPADLARIGRQLDDLTPLTPEEELRITYMMGALAAARGDSEAAMAHASALRLLPDSVHGGRQLDFALSVEAQDLFARGEFQDALATLEEVSFAVPDALSFDNPNFSLIRERYLMGELLRLNGQEQDALGWYAAVADGITPVNPVFESIFLPAAHVRRGDILRELGRTQEAADRYTAFLELWDGADQELQPQVARVRSVLEELGR